MSYSSLYPKAHSRCSEFVEYKWGKNAKLQLESSSLQCARAPPTGLFSNCRQLKPALHEAGDENSVVSRGFAFPAAVFSARSTALD